ncbi:MAG: hypothetical protein EOO06_20715 [Chitinophagaceae bacterium]|nr:MAG: hypothetical protein EOO06_20715 [Chitinophagaceae bacterium]
MTGSIVAPAFHHPPLLHTSVAKSAKRRWPDYLLPASQFPSLHPRQIPRFTREDSNKCAAVHIRELLS